MGQLEPSYNNPFPISLYFAEKFSREYEVYVCPFCITLFSKRTGVYIEHSICPNLGPDKTDKTKGGIT